MEGLLANVTGYCPASFSGVSGYLLAQAITTVVAAHCAFDDQPWPRDMAEEIISKSEDEITYDFIIVGAGTAGSLLANRISNNFQERTILLIEAGDDPNFDSEVPALFYLKYNKDEDWNYKTEKSGFNCKGFDDNQCIWSKGKGMGGSSSMNAMIYTRGHPKNYDDWDIPGWTYADVRPYFENIEKEFEINELEDVRNPWHNVVEEAWSEIGLNPTKQTNKATIGTKTTKMLIKDGKRLNTAKSCLSKVGDNVHVMKRTKVKRIIVNKDSWTAIGVELETDSGKTIIVKSAKEIILSAGSISTPQILMLSGIGPHKHLQDMGIETVADLSVGKNLQDHVMFPIIFKIDEAHSFEITAENMILSFIQYMLSKTGPLSNLGLTNFMCFADTRKGDHPDIQYHHILFPKNNRVGLKSYLKGVGYKDEIYNVVERHNEHNSLLMIFPTLLHPKSFGELLLNDINHVTNPIIKANYLQENDDVNTLIKSIRILQELQSTRTFRDMGITIPYFKLYPCSNYYEDSDDYWSCYIEHMASTVFHPVGTAAMGLDDKTSVVDSQLHVHGFHNLRVVDASVIPKIPGGNTMAASLMIAEKGFEFIKTDHKHFKHEL